MFVRDSLLLFALGILASALAARSLAAATASAPISVTATVQASCLVSATATAFRTYEATPNLASAVSIACSNSIPYVVTLSGTPALAASRGLRETNHSDFVLLGYAPGPNIRGIANWGQGLSTSAASGFGSGAASELSVLGQRSAARNSTAAAFADTLIVVVTY